MAWFRVIRSCTSCSSSTSSPSFVRMCSKNFGSIRTYGAGSQIARGLVGPTASPDWAPAAGAGAVLRAP
jgi:hypothetical protein